MKHKTVKRRPPKLPESGLTGQHLLDWLEGTIELVPEKKIGRPKKRRKPKRRAKPRLTVGRLKREMPVPTTNALKQEHPDLQDTLLPMVERALAKSGEPAMVFGLMATNDSALVSRMRKGQHVKKQENRDAIIERANYLLSGGAPKMPVPDDGTKLTRKVE